MWQIDYSRDQRRSVCARATSNGVYVCRCCIQMPQKKPHSACVPGGPHSEALIKH